MAQQIQLRRGSSSEWTLSNPILAEGELGLELNTNLYKIGDGSTPWNSLSYRQLSATHESIVFNEQLSDMGAAASGTGQIYVKSVGGRILPKFIGPSGLDTSFQPSFFGNGIQMYSPGTATVPQALGGPALTSVGTVSHPVLNSTNLRTQTSRFSVLSAATAGSAAESRCSFARIYRGDQPKLGGFFHRTRFSIVSTLASQRSFFGFTASTSATPVTQEPRLIVNSIGIGNGSSETTLRIFSNTATGTAVEVDLGINFPANDPTAVYDFTLFHVPNGTSCSWEVKNLTTGDVATGVIADLDLPISTLFLAYHAYMNNGGVTGQVNFDIMRIYTETDY